MEAVLTADELIVSVRALKSSSVTKAKPLAVTNGSPVRAAADGDCLPCGVSSCQRTTAPATGVRWFFPASALGRKGIHELAQALRETGGELLVFGHAREGGDDPLANISYRTATLAELATSTALVIPAWIEHEPRLALPGTGFGDSCYRQPGVWAASASVANGNRRGRRRVLASRDEEMPPSHTRSHAIA